MLRSSVTPRRFEAFTPTPLLFVLTCKHSVGCRSSYLQGSFSKRLRRPQGVPVGFLQGSFCEVARPPLRSAPLRALSMAVASPTGRRRLIPCPRVIAALLAPPPTSGAVVAPPGLPPRGSLRRLAPRAPRVRPGSLRRLGGVLPAPVLLAPCGSRSAPLLAALLIAPRVLGALPPPRGSPQMARQGSPPRLGARPYASACGLAAPSPPSLREAFAFPRRSRRVPAVSDASPGLHGSGKALRFTCAPCAPLRSPSWCHARLRSASAVSARLRRFLSFLLRCAPIGWGGAVPPSSFGLVLTTVRFLPLSVLSVPSCRSCYLFVWRRRVWLCEPWPTLRPSARVPLPVPPLGRGPNSPPSFPRSLWSRPPYGRASGRAVETFFVGYAQPVPNVACVFCEATTSWAEREPWHPTKAVPAVPSSLSAPLLWGRVGEAVQEWTHVDLCCVPSSLHVDLRESIPTPPLYCLRLPRLLISPRRSRRSTTAAATFCHCLRYAHLFRSMAGGFSNCVVDV